MELNTTSSSPVISTSSTGPIYKTISMERQVKVYAATEADLRLISLFSTIQNAMAGFGSFVLSYLITISWDVYTSNDPMKARMGKPLILGCSVLVAVSLTIWLVARSKKNSELDNILKESIPR